jgi:steroid delta-isomerase-like uncharacterized protein
VNKSNFKKEKFTMSTRETQNKAIARRYVAAHAGNDRNVLEELLSSDVAVYHAGSALNRDGLLQSIGMFSTVASDIVLTVEDQIAEGDKVMTRGIWRGTHSGNFQGLPPTGRQIALSAFFAQRIRDGKIVEQWFLFDQLSFMQQLGLVPPPQPAK